MSPVVPAEGFLAFDRDLVEQRPNCRLTNRQQTEGPLAPTRPLNGFPDSSLVSTKIWEYDRATEKLLTPLGDIGQVFDQVVEEVRVLALEAEPVPLLEEGFQPKFVSNRAAMLEYLGQPLKYFGCAL